MNATLDPAALIRELYEQWVAALRARNYGWMEKHLADDYMFSAHPFPDVRLGKAAFIELDRKIGRADIEWLSVKADRVGDIVVASAVADVKEEFTADIGAGLPGAAELNRMFSGVRVAYASAWRNNGSIWQCFDQHMIGSVSRR